MFEILTRAGLTEFTILFVAVCATVSALAWRRGTDEARTLQKENRRLRNIVANLMIDNAQIRDTR